MTKTIGALMGLALAFTISTSAIPAPACPEVDSARAMLAQAAAKQNERELQAPRDQGQGAQTPKDQQGASREAGKQDTVPPQMKRAALLVREADTACQAGNAAEAAEKAKAAIGLMQQQ